MARYNGNRDDRGNGRHRSRDDDEFDEGLDELGADERAARLAEARMAHYGRRRGVGRPSTLTPELIDLVYAMLLTGADQNDVAGAIGVGQSTFYHWMTRGRQQQEAAARGDEPANDLYRQFLEAVEQAQAMFVVNSLAAIQQAASRSPAVMLELLGRKYPMRYGQTAKRPMSAADIMEAIDTLPDDEYNKLFANYAARGFAVPALEPASGPTGDGTA